MAAGLISCLRGAIGWALQLPGFSGKAFWSGGTGSYTQQWGCEFAFLPGQSHKTVSIKQYGSLAGNPNQAEMTTKLPGHMGPLAWLCGWPKLLGGTSAWGLCQ